MYEDMAECGGHCAKLNKPNTEKTHNLGYIWNQNILGSRKQRIEW